MLISNLSFFHCLEATAFHSFRLVSSASQKMSILDISSYFDEMQRVILIPQLEPTKGPAIPDRDLDPHIEQHAARHKI
jgi:hypothetical protein